MMPIASVTAKPRIGPDPSVNRASAAISVVRWESMIVANALLKPVSIALIVERPALRFLAHAFVDQHVGVHRHAHREHDAGNAGQRQRRADGGQDADHQEQCWRSAR